VCAYFAIFGAIPGFFLSSLIFMLLWKLIAPIFSLPIVSYPQAMLITITLWLAVAPLVAVGWRSGTSFWVRRFDR
jgi:hypothetical protein